MVYTYKFKNIKKIGIKIRKKPTYPFCVVFNSNCIENFIHNYIYIYV